MASEEDKAEARRQIKAYKADLDAVNLALNDISDTIRFYKREIARSKKLRDFAHIRKMRKGIADAQVSQRKFTTHADELTKRIANLKRIR